MVNRVGVAEQIGPEGRKRAGREGRLDELSGFTGNPRQHAAVLREVGQLPRPDLHIARTGAVIIEMNLNREGPSGTLRVQPSLARVLRPAEQILRFHRRHRAAPRPSRRVLVTDLLEQLHRRSREYRSLVCLEVKERFHFTPLVAISEAGQGEVADMLSVPVAQREGGHRCHSAKLTK